VGRGSVCRNDGFCSNRFESGCLSALRPEENSTRVRVCNSEDPPEAATEGICRIPDFDYGEIRLFCHTWESVILEDWIMQVILSELLDVPTSIEPGVPGARINLYDSQRSMEYGGNADWGAVARGADYGDCRLASKEPYESCAHVLTEVWDSHNAWEMTAEGIAEPPQGLGVLGQEGWFTPKFTGQRDPSILNYLGLQGEENRRKLADMFLRPTTWKDYCDEVSTSNCTAPDEVASRGPRDASEEERMFVEGIYTGHFRKTDENDCDRNPHNCTGSIVDYPCGWSSFVTQQTYHLDIALKSSGPMAGPGGYYYSQMVEIWKAANATKSNVIMYWWSPDFLFESFVGTDAEFTRIALPNPTQTCIENRVYSLDRCPEFGIATAEELAGSPLGACDDPPNPISKIISTGLHDMTFDPSIPDALRSPGYDVVKQFGLSDLQLSDVFQYWKKYNDPREAVCEWVVDNQEWAMEFIPRTHPRVLKQETTRSRPLQYASYSLAGLALIMVIGTSAAVVQNRKKRAIVFAQIEFLVLLLAGLFIISLGALMTSLPASDGTCVASVWFINIGYSLELIPLLVKISAINKLMSAASRMKRVVLSRNALFGTVLLICLAVVMFLTVWTILDPPRESEEYTIDEEVDATEVLVTTYCSPEKDLWSYIMFAWISGLLVATTVLAIQSRKTRKDFNESQTLGVMIYSHFVFVVLRVAIHTLPSGFMSHDVLAQYQSIIFSVDTVVTLVVYFFPKLANTRRPRGSQRSSVFLTTSAIQGNTSTDQDRLSGLCGSYDNRTQRSSGSPSLPRGHRYKCSHCGDCMDGEELIEVLVPVGEGDAGGTDEVGSGSSCDEVASAPKGEKPFPEQRPVSDLDSDLDWTSDSEECTIKA